MKPLPPLHSSHSSTVVLDLLGTVSFQPIGSPFPDAPVKVKDQQNQYVALWYKHGKPIHGRSWNDGGNVACSFPYPPTKAELTGVKDLGGQIQILTYKGDHMSLGYWYEWIQYKDRFGSDDRQMVKCGESMPILWWKEGGPILGYLDNKTEKASFSHDKTVTQFEGGKLADMWIIMRNIKGGPPFCECDGCPKPLPPPPPPPPTKEDPKPVPVGPPPPRVMHNEWLDAKVGDPWPKRTMVQAMGKSLDAPIAGMPADQFVALWYFAGEPVMGRIWNEGGKIAANFSWKGKEFKGNVGSIQILVQLGENVRGYDYSWVPYKEAAVFGEQAKTFNNVYVDNGKVFISPCVVVKDGKQVLGKADVRSEQAGYGHDGKQVELTGPKQCEPCFVLVRKAREGYKFD